MNNRRTSRYCNLTPTSRSFWLMFATAFFVVQPGLRSFFYVREQLPNFTNGSLFSWSMLLSQIHQNVTTDEAKEEREIVNVARDPYLPLPQVVAKTAATWQRQEVQSNSDVYGGSSSSSKRHPNRHRPLNFLHIPKTGGTSIVMAAARAGYAWSDCMFPQRRTTKECPDYPLNFLMEDNNKNNHNQTKNLSQLYHPQRWKNLHPLVGPWWHLPIQYFPDDPFNPYQNQDLFVVLRNPYQRVVSQYYYRCLRDKQAPCYLLGSNRGRNSGDAGVDVDTKPKDTPEQMNLVVQRMIRKQRQAKLGSRPYFFHDGHWIPQSHYVYNITSTTARNTDDDMNNFSIFTITPPPQRLVQHTLHFECLAEQFPSLMQAYNCGNISLPPNKINNRSYNDYVTNATVDDLTLESLQLIEEVYHDDFVLGGYPKLSTHKHQTR
jgi:hypothetical protein